ncbi:hypothetical protein D9M71_549310 [compost metagenome]
MSSGSTALMDTWIWEPACFVIEAINGSQIVLKAVSQAAIRKTLLSLQGLNPNSLCMTEPSVFNAERSGPRSANARAVGVMLRPFCIGTNNGSPISSRKRESCADIAGWLM